jgi:hypothetical protein
MIYWCRKVDLSVDEEGKKKKKKGEILFESTRGPQSRSTSPVFNHFIPSFCCSVFPL